METIPLEPAESSIFIDFKTHSFVEKGCGLGLVPSNSPLYFALFFYVLVPAAWYLTRDLDLAQGLKLTAWLFPLLAGTGPLVLWIVMSRLFARFFFNIYRSELVVEGFRFQGRKTIPFGDILGVQICYGGRMKTEEGGYEKYELNVVLKKDRRISRIHLVGHPEREVIERQAKRITAKVPIQLFDHMDESIRAWSEREGDAA